jgi:hypothetical protein
MPDLGGSTASSWLPLVTAFLGYALSAITEFLRDIRAHKREIETQASLRDREREARDEARRDERFERRTEFQRETLLNLQEEVFKLMRTTAEMQHSDVMALRSGVQWHKQLYPADLDERAFSSNVQTTKLKVRVADEGVRELVSELRKDAGSVLMSDSEAAGEQASRRMTQTYDKLNERIGELLRKLDNDADEGELKKTI